MKHILVFIILFAVAAAWGALLYKTIMNKPCDLKSFKTIDEIPGECIQHLREVR
jgi:hypothetical protein